jgi:hypothetical protein
MTETTERLPWDETHNDIFPEDLGEAHRSRSAPMPERESESAAELTKLANVQPRLHMSSE